ncbi:MAG: methylmalonyl-CoA mutase family protein [Antricoccus sp.]
MSDPLAPPTPQSYAPPIATAEQWHAALAVVLAKSGRFADGDDPATTPALLTKKTIDGIAITPLAGTEIARQLRSTPSGSAATRGPIATQDRGPGDVPGWDLRVPVTDVETAAHAADELNGGANSLLVTVRPGALDEAQFAALLTEVLLDVAPIVLDTDRPATVGQQLIDAAVSQGIALHPDTNFGVDPIGELLLTGRRDLDEQVATVAELASSAGIRGFIVDATIVHDAGAGEVLELGYATAAGVALLRKLDEVGYRPEQAAKLIEFRYAATDQQFTTIAKFRAARAMWSRVCEVLDIESNIQCQHAVTSRRMMTAYDPYTNLLRTTIATFAAAIGGATAITVQPFDAAVGQAQGFGHRLARNISNLLINESHIGQVSDPAGGAGSLEALTDSLARAAWEQFTGIEKAGGIEEFVDSGELETMVTEVAAHRKKLIATRRLAITGVSEFPQTNENILERASGYSRFGEYSKLTPMRDAEEFEQLRRKPPARAVFLAPIGSVSAHTARANFAANCFAAVGIATINGTPQSAPEVLAEHYRESGAGAACIVGSDPGYRDSGPALIAALRKAGATHIIVAGKPIAEVADLVDDHLAAGADILAFARQTRVALGEESK